MSVVTAGESRRQERRVAGAMSGGAFWRQALPVVALISLVVAIFSYPHLQLLEMGRGNTSTHLNFAVQIEDTGVLYPGQFLYHVLVVAVHRVLPMTWFQAHLVVVLGAQAGSALIIWAAFRRLLGVRIADRFPLLPVVGAVGLLLASAISFLTWQYGNHYHGYLVPNVYVSQTYTVLQPVSLLAFFAAVRVLRPDGTGWTARALLTLTAFAILSTIAKPSYVMCLIPAVFLLLLWRDRLRQFRRLVLMAVILAVPVLAVIAWQYTSTYLDVQDLDVAQDAGMRIAPFKVIGRHSVEAIPDSTRWWLLPKFVLSILFPLTVAASYFRQARRDSRMTLGWLQFAVGLVYAYFVAEYPRYEPGNFIWSAHITLFILFVVSLLFTIERGVERYRTGQPLLGDYRLMLCVIVLLVHVAAGTGMLLSPTLSLSV